MILLHGFPQTSRAWVRTASHLTERYRLVISDLRGAGEPARPAHGYEKKTMAADIHALAASLGIGKTYLAGHDIGGMVAYAYAAQWPNEVKSLALIELLLPGFGLEAMWAIRKPGEFAHMPFFMAPDLPEWLIKGNEAAFFDWFIRDKVYDQNAFQPADIDAYVRTYTQPGALRAGFDWYRAFWQDATDNQAFAKTKLTMPVLAVFRYPAFLAVCGHCQYPGEVADDLWLKRFVFGDQHDPLHKCGVWEASS